jgi:drug/metabolite transporter (DMT)-like permease
VASICAGLARLDRVLAVVLALGSSACYGVSNFIGPQLARQHALVSVLVLSQLAALLACALYVAEDGGAALPTSGLLLALLAGVGNAVGLIGFYKAAELGPLAVAAPIGATGAVMPVVWGLSTGDTLKWTQVVGMVLAMGGAARAARRSAEGEGSARSYPDPRLSAIYAAISAVAFGTFLTALPKATEDGRAWALLDARIALIVLIGIWAGRRLAGVRVEGRSLPLLAVPGLLLVLGTLLYTIAADHGQLSLVSVLGSLFPVFTVGLGMVVLGERLSRAQAVGVGAALAGIVLIAA